MKDFQHLVFCISGYSKSGKDEFSKPLIERYKAVKIGMTDAPRRHMMEIFGFSRDQMFGSAYHKDRGDLRFPKPLFHQYNLLEWTQEIAKSQDVPWVDNGVRRYFCVADTRDFWMDTKKFRKEYTRHPVLNLTALPNAPSYANFAMKITIVDEGDPNFWLSSREVLQIHCTALQNMHPDVWVKNFIDKQCDWMKGTMAVLTHGSQKTYYNALNYTQAEGFVNGPKTWDSCGAVICTDLRHKREIRHIRQNAARKGYTPVLVRVKRTGIDSPPYDHPTETEQATIPDSVFDFVVVNDSDVRHLHALSRSIFKIVTSGDYRPKIEILP